MDVGIGLPSTIRGTTREQLLEWARRAEARGFSSLGTIDRIAYGNYEPLIALAAAGAVTERIKLATTVLLAPTRRDGTLLAKQAASVNALVRRAPRARRRGRRARGRLRGGRRRLPQARAATSTRCWRSSSRPGTATRSARRPADADHRRQRARGVRAHGEVRRRLGHGRRHARHAARRRREDARGLEGGRSRRRAADHVARLLRAGRRRQGRRPRLPRRLLRVPRRLRRHDRRQRRDRRGHRPRVRPGLRRTPAATS